MNERFSFDPNRILPVGTQVVTLVELEGLEGKPACPKGAVGVVVAAPSSNAQPYRIRFLDNVEAALMRPQLSVRKQYQREGFREASSELAERDLTGFVILRCIVGSRAYGLNDENSDTDRRGIYLPPAELHWSLYGIPEQLENDDTQEAFWELQKFLVLALKANPNVLEVLYSPLIEQAAPIAEELLEMRDVFVSRLVYQTYNGYVMSQFKKLEQDLRARGAIKWKHAMHLVRLLLSGVTALREGYIPVRVDEHRDRLLAIKRGETPWEEIDAWRLSLHKEFDAAFAATRLPEKPDFDRVNRFLIRARRSVVR